MNISSQFVDMATLKPDKFKDISSENITDKNLKKVCNDFESFFMNQLLDISLKSTNVAGKVLGLILLKVCMLKISLHNLQEI